AVGRLDGSRARAVCDLSRHRRARARHPFQPGMGAGEHDSGLGGARADHPDLDARFRRDGGAGGHCRDRQCDPAVSDGGIGIACHPHAGHQAAPSGAGDPFRRGYPVGRMLSPTAAGAARAPHRLHPWSRHRSALRLPGCDHAGLRPRSQSPTTVRRSDPAADAAGVSALHRPQPPAACRYPGAGAGAGAVSARGQIGHRRRYPDQRRVGRHHRLCRPLVAGARMSDFLGDWHALLVLFMAGFLPNEVWRMLGLWLGGGADEGSQLLVWVRAVATAILAGVIAQILLEPPGALASVPGWLRYGAVAAGFAAFIATRRSIFAGVVCGELLMLAGNSKSPRRNGMNSRARSALISCLVIVAAFAAAPDVRAAEFPTRPIKLVIPYAAGGPTDIFGRLLAEYLGKDLKQG